jgi:DNA-binding NarL/FixJ family response regulator
MIAESGPQNSGRIAVAVVTGDPMRHRQLLALLEPDARLHLVQSDGSDVDAVQAITALAPEDNGNGAVVVVDVPSRLGDDLELVRAISRETDEVPIVVVGPEPDLALATLIAGASGVVPREPSAEELCDAVACVAYGDAAVTPEVATTLVRRYQRLDED